MKINWRTTYSFYRFLSEYVEEFGEYDMKEVGYEELYKQYVNFIK